MQKGLNYTINTFIHHGLPEKTRQTAFSELLSTQNFLSKRRDVSGILFLWLTTEDVYLQHRENHIHFCRIGEKAR